MCLTAQVLSHCLQLRKRRGGGGGQALNCARVTDASADSLHLSKANGQRHRPSTSLCKGSAFKKLTQIFSMECNLWRANSYKSTKGVHRHLRSSRFCFTRHL